MVATSTLPDGRIVLGGGFTLCGNVEVNGVALWNPATGTFQALGSGAANGLDGPAYAFAIAGSDIYVGGSFTLAGGAAARAVARFNITTQTWSPLGTDGFGGVYDFPNSYFVNALAIVGDDVYVGGNFAVAGSAAANNIARFNTSTQTWSALGSGVANGVNSGVYGLAVAGSDVYVGGGFTEAGGAVANHVARFSSSTQTWSSLGSGVANGVNGSVSALGFSGGDVYAGGFFDQAGGAAASNVARFNATTETWSPLGSGMTNGVNGYLLDLAISGGDVYVGGSFNHAGGATANYVARFSITTQAWSALGSGATNGVDFIVYGLAISGGDVYAGGWFSQAGGTAANHVARFNTAAQVWSPLGSGAANGMNGDVDAFAIVGSDVYAGGYFTQAGGATVNRVARFNSSTQTWTALGSGVANGSNTRAYVLAVTGSDVYVGGDFTTAGGATANRVARFNTTTQTWSPLGSGAANGVDGDVRALIIAGTDVYVGGEFTQAGGVAANGVARFDTTTQTWFPLGSVAANGVDGNVRALVIADSDVYVGGEFTQAGGQAANAMARFNTITQTWFPVGSGVSSGIFGGTPRVNAFAIAGSDIYVGGEFIQAGGAAANRVARYNITTQVWSSLGSGAANGVQGDVRALAIAGSDVYVGGIFSELGGAVGNGVVRFNTTTQTWFPLGNGAANGVGGFVWALGIACTNDAGSPLECAGAARVRDLYLGGQFDQAGPNFSLSIAGHDIRRETTSSISASTGPSVSANMSITFTGNVATTSFPPQPGTVEFRDNGAAIASCVNQPVVGGADTRASTCDTSALRVGSHDIVARYGGDALNFIGTSDPMTLTITAPALSVLPETLPNASLGVNYNQPLSLSGSGFTAPVTYAVSAGSVPNGLTLNSVSGEISGIPSTPGTFNFIVRGTDSSTTSATGGAFSASRAYTVTTSRQSTSIAMGTISPSPSLVGQAYSVPVTVSSAQSTPDGLLVTCTDGTGGSDTQVLSNGQATCTLNSTSAGAKTITVTFAAQGDYSASVGTASHTVQNANEAPTLVYAPTPGNLVTLTGAGTTVGSAATGAVNITVNGGRGTGNATLGCNVSGGNFQLQGSPSGPIVPGSSPPPLSVGCTRTAAQQDGTLSCTETSNPGSSQQQRSWPLRCPAAGAVPPTLTYVPEPNNTVVFPSGNVNQTVSTSIQVNSSGAVGSGSTTVSCQLNGGQAAAFQLTGGNGQTVSTTQGGQPLQLQCTLGNSLRSTTLSCTETDSPGGVTRGRTWPLTCGPGVATADGVVTVGARNAVRGGQVAIPITFRGEGQTRDFRAEMSFNKTHLTVRQVTPVGGATCARRPMPNDDRIEVQRGTAGPLSAEDTRYCEVTFQVASNAPGGALPLPVVASTCLDTGGASKPCTTSDGRVAVAALDPSPADGAAIVIAGYDGTQTRTLRVVNRGAVPQELSGCTVLPSTGLSVTQPTAFPLAIPVQTERQVTLSCVLPPLNQPRLATLTCDTNDAMRSQMRYGVTCMRLPEGTPLPAEQVLDIEQRAGEQQGTSAARGDSGGTTKGTVTDTVTFLGAPLGGSDGNGRVAVYADAGTPIGKARGEWQAGAMRRVATLEVPLLLRGWDKGTSGATERLGQALALRADGAVLAVGAPQGGPTGAGRVYLYERPAGGWALFDSRTAQPQTLEAPSLPGGATLEYGAAIAYTPQGDLLVGAPGATVGVSGAGAVFAHAWNGTGFDAPVSVVSAQPVGNGRFGSALAANDDDLLVGAPGEFSTGVKTGAAYRLTLQSGIPGSPVRLVPTTALAANDQYGAAVAIAGEQWFVGAPGDDTAQGADSGSVMAFRGGPAPTQLTQLLPATGAQQGAGSALTANDRHLFVGAPQADTTTQVDAGRTYVYALKATYAATEPPKSALDNAAGRANDQFGRSLVVGNGLLIVGVPQADVILSDTTQLEDVGRADPFLLIELFGNGFE